MLSHNVTPPAQVGEITVSDVKRQEQEDRLTRSNWRFFYAMGLEDKSPNPGTDRRDDGDSGRK